MKSFETIEKVTKRTSICSLGDDDLHDFRKKGKSHVYKSKFKPESKEFVWEEDSCSDTLKKSFKKIIRKWSKKTDRTEKVGRSEIVKETFEPETDIKSNFSEFSSSDHHLDFDEIFKNSKENLEEKQRLFESDCLHSRTQTPSSKSPFIAANFLDEVDEIEFGEEEMCIFEFGENDLSASAPLNSLEKSFDRFENKGHMFDIPMVAITDDLGIEDDEEDF